jgi:SpoIID/LytB domain protein
MKAANRPVTAAVVLAGLMVASMLAGAGLASCSALGIGGGRRVEELAKETYAEPVGEIYKVAGISEEPDMRVRVAVAVPAATLDGPEAFWVGPVGERRYAELLKGPIEVVLDEEAWTVKSGSGQPRVWPRSKDLELSPVTDKSGEAAWANLNGVRYTGSFRLLAPKPAPRTDLAAKETGEAARVLGSGQPSGGAAKGRAGPVPFDVIEVIKLEEYLTGVVAKELYRDWSLQTFKVQAIAARSYALHERQRSIAAGRKYDVEATTQDQAYGGATLLPVAVRAVRETRGMILEHGGAVLRAYYSSTCGGRAASARDTWPIDRGYEFNLAAPIQGKDRPHACEGSPLYRWKVERPKAELVKRLAAYGQRNGLLLRQIKDLARIEVLRTNDTGRPAEYKIVEPGGKWYALSAEQLRIACNADAPGAPSITRQTRVNSGDLEFVVEGSTVTISGRGFGHGVGMCQYCARAMADRGEDIVAMLERFYPGARVVRAY